MSKIPNNPSEASILIHMTIHTGTQNLVHIHALSIALHTPSVQLAQESDPLGTKIFD